MKPLRGWCYLRMVTPPPALCPPTRERGFSSRMAGFPARASHHPLPQKNLNRGAVIIAVIFFYFPNDAAMMRFFFIVSPLHNHAAKLFLDDEHVVVDVLAYGERRARQFMSRCQALARALSCGSAHDSISCRSRGSSRRDGWNGPGRTAVRKKRKRWPIP